MAFDDYMALARQQAAMQAQQGYLQAALLGGIGNAMSAQAAIDGNQKREASELSSEKLLLLLED